MPAAWPHETTPRADRRPVGADRAPFTRQEERPGPHRRRQPHLRQRLPVGAQDRSGLGGPARSGSASTTAIWKRYDRWSAAGVWEQVGRTLGEDLTRCGGRPASAARQHHGQGAPDGVHRPPPGGRVIKEADDRRCLGRSRGGACTKLHAALCGVTGRLLNLVLTPGHRGDCAAGPELLDGLRPSLVLADGAYDANELSRSRGGLRRRHLHQAHPDAEAEVALRRGGVQASERDRAVLPPDQGVSAGGDAVREEGHQLRQLRLAGSGRHGMR